MTGALRWKLFWGAAVSINLIGWWMVHAVPKPAVAVGAALDVAVTAPALYFLLIVRAGLQPLASMVPLCLLALLRASYIAPGLAAARPWLSVGAEMAVLALIATRVRRGLRASGAGDMLERLEAAALEIVPARRVAAVLATEIALFYYAFFAWHRKPETPAGARAFSIHQQSGVAALFGMLAGVGAMEAALVHLVVMRWSPAAAWVLTAVSAYGSVWLIGMSRAFALRPVLVIGREVLVRGGMMWTVRVPVEAIASIDFTGEFDLKVPPASEPTLVIRLTEPLTAHGMYGMTRRVSRLGIGVDDPAGFMETYRGL